MLLEVQNAMPERERKQEKEIVITAISLEHLFGLFCATMGGAMSGGFMCLAVW